MQYNDYSDFYSCNNGICITCILRILSDAVLTSTHTILDYKKIDVYPCTSLFYIKVGIPWSRYPHVYANAKVANIEHDHQDNMSV